MRLVPCLALSAALLAMTACPVRAQSTNPKAYAASTDLREYVNGRASSPKDGSFFYSHWARWECLDDASVARRIARDAPPRPGSKQAAALLIQLERCRNLPVELSDSPFQIADIKAGQAAGDKLFGKFNGKDGAWFYVGDQQGLRRALQLFSPDMDKNMLWVLAQELAGLGVQPRLTVNGQRLSESEGRSLYLAFLLAACDLNVDCGSSHRWMRLWCIQNGECDDATIEGYWRRRDLNEQYKSDWQSIGRYRSIIYFAAKSGDWSSFALLPDGKK